MPIHFTIDAKKQRIITIATPPIVDAELLDYVNGVHTNPAFAHGMTELADASLLGPNDLLITPEGIKAMIAREQSYGEHHRRRKHAIYAPDDLQFGVARTYQTYSEIAKNSPEVKVFRDRSKALEWLDE